MTTDQPRLPFRMGQKTAAPAFIKAEPTERVKTTVAAAAQAFLDADEEKLKHEFPADPSKEPVTLREEDITPIERLTDQERAEVLGQIQELAEIDRKISATSSAFAKLDETAAVNRERAAAAGLIIAGAEGEERNNVIPEPQPAPLPAEDADSGIKAEPKRCRRCGFDQTKTSAVEVDETDRYAWLLTLHGARFKKTYLLAGGKLAITFRMLTPGEAQLAYEQTGVDMKGKAELGLPAYVARLWENRLALSLEKVEFADGRTFPVPTERLLAGRSISGANTVIPAIHEYIRTHVVPSESLMRLVGRKFTNFQDLQERLEQEAEGDFTGEISGQS